MNKKSRIVFFMARNTQEFETVIRVNAQQAKDELKTMQERLDELKRKKDTLLSGKNYDAKDLRTLNKEIRQQSAAVKAFGSRARPSRRSAAVCRTPFTRSVTWIRQVSVNCRSRCATSGGRWRTSPTRRSSDNWTRSCRKPTRASLSSKARPERRQRRQGAWQRRQRRSTPCWRMSTGHRCLNSERRQLPSGRRWRRPSRTRKRILSCRPTSMIKGVNMPGVPSPTPTGACTSVIPVYRQTMTMTVALSPYNRPLSFIFRSSKCS